MRHAGVEGSSPRVWGRPPSPVWCLLPPRFIPTRVGQAAECAVASWAYPVHPHACGAGGYRVRQAHLNGGSSPRVWGRRVGECGDGKINRFIPTRVGQASCTDQRGSWRAVHPHACGAGVALVILLIATAGSSPRVWGRLSRKLFLIEILRFIPTRVGRAVRSPSA